MPRVGEHSQHHGVAQGEPTQPLLLVGVQRGRNGTVSRRRNTMMACSSTMGGWPSTVITPPLDPSLAGEALHGDDVAGSFLLRNATDRPRDQRWGS